MVEMASNLCYMILDERRRGYKFHVRKVEVKERKGKEGRRASCGKETSCFLCVLDGWHGLPVLTAQWFSLRE